MGSPYEIPISWGFAPSRFFMAFRPISLPTNSDFEVATMASWYPGPQREDMDSVESFLLKFAVVGGIFLVALSIAYLAQ